MYSLSVLIENMLSDDRVVAIVGKDQNDATKILFKGTVLDAWQHRKTSLKNYMYRDVIDICPVTVNLKDGVTKAGLKVVIYCEYGFRD